MSAPGHASNPRAYLTSLEQFGIKLGLSTIDALCDALGRPERAYPSILIAGTNGKGSTAAFVDEALRAAGRRTGRYTSPHLIRLEERFHVDGQPITASALDDALDQVRQATERLRTQGALETYPTYFETTTAAAFVLFERAAIDVAVLEVGLGGRFDATNIVTPIATAITSIALDHERQLGTTLAAIAAEKAGIAKRGVPVVVGDLPTAARTVVEAVGRERGAELVEASAGVRAESSLTRGVTTLRLRTPAHDYGRMRLSLRGDHQVANAIVAVRLLELPHIPVAAIRRGIEGAQWPGRVDLRTLPDGRTLLIDGAHNPAGAAALAAYLRREHPGGVPLVFGAMADKDLKGMMDALATICRPLIVTVAPGTRAAGTAALVAAAEASGVTAVVESDLEGALAAAWSRSRDIAVAGSLYLAGAVLDWLERRAGMPA